LITQFPGFIGKFSYRICINYIVGDLFIYLIKEKMNKLLIIALLFFGCDIVEPDVYGCTDDTACNYNVDANISSNCEYIIDECGICGGKSSGTCSPDTKALLNTKELCESADGFWIPNCN